MASEPTNPQTTLTEEQIKSIMPSFADFGEQVVGKATLYYLCEMALKSLYLHKIYVSLEHD